MKLNIKRYKDSGFLVNKYQPLHNLVLEDGSISDFRIKDFGTDLTKPISLECQPSYDGTVNIIMNDDKNPPRIINSRFVKTEGERYRVIERNQKTQTNLYNKTFVDQQTRLFQTSNLIPKFDLLGVTYSGQLKGGNYVFYLRLADNDYNETNIVAESGEISIFKGTINNPSTISGTIMDERTDKSIKLQISNIDNTYSKFYLYYVRNTSDANGFLIQHAFKLTKPYDVNGDSAEITINGFEEELEITVEELNINYNTATSVRTQTQVQNMLFFGNVERTMPNNTQLQTASLYIEVSAQQKNESIGYINKNYTLKTTDSDESTEYYNPKNLYYYLGYWPEEMYRLGIVYIMNDDTLSPVYNLRGCDFSNKKTELRNFEYLDELPILSESQTYIYKYNNTYNTYFCYDAITGKVVIKQVDGVSYYVNDKGVFSTYKVATTPGVLQRIDTLQEFMQKRVNLYTDDSKTTLNVIENELIDDDLTNTYGVFINPQKHIIDNSTVKPLYYRMRIPDQVLEFLQNSGVKGFFFVRQKRIPFILGQGLAIGINKTGHMPMPYSNSIGKYYVESFVNKSYDGPDGEDSKLEVSTIKRFIQLDESELSSFGLLSLDAMCNPILQSTYDGSEFTLVKEANCNIGLINRSFEEQNRTSDNTYGGSIQTKLLFIDSDVPSKLIDDYAFSTRAGNAESTSDFAFVSETIWRQDTEHSERNTMYTSRYPKITRGIYCPFIGTTSFLDPNAIYNIRHANYSSIFNKEYIKQRGDSRMPFFAISDRYSLEEGKNSIDVYRGDCYSNTVTIRINRNFVDTEVPVSNMILDKSSWIDHYYGYNYESRPEEGDEYTDYSAMNRADVNAVPMGLWITFKCLSNYNLGLRAADPNYPNEEALMGNKRTFFPLNSKSTDAGYKIPESCLLNLGYSSTVGERRNFIWENVPYIKDQFDNRVMFSNVQEEDAFKNAYRIFQGLSYKDIDRQFGAIVKLLPWNRDLLCVFEHGVGVLPVNTQALMQTSTGQSVHLYGAGVLTSNVSVVSQDFGSIWQDSIIKTPMGVYGVDTYAKKIWRVNLGNSHMEVLSDLKVQRYLNDNIKLSEFEDLPTMAIKNVKTHYNNYKGDVMFTFYNKEKNTKWNLCYNERTGKWITRYSWTPLCSENINNQYYSFDQLRAELLAITYRNRFNEYGLVAHRNDDSALVFGPYEIEDNNSVADIHIELKGYDEVTEIQTKINSIETSYLDDSDTELFIKTDEKNPWEHEVEYEDSEEETHTEIVSDFTDFVDVRFGETLNKETINIKIENLIKWFNEYSGIKDVPLYVKLNTTTSMFIDDSIVPTKIDETIVVYFTPNPDYKMIFQKDKLLRNAFYIHGRAGIFDEINYEDSTFENQILPTKWYNKQEPFEFEFVVNGDVGLHKIFNNLVIISNNVQPKEFEFEIVGDVYRFNKEGIYRADTFDENEFDYAQVKYSENLPYKISQKFENCKIVWDNNLNSYGIRMREPSFNMSEVGRLMGNIQYKEDAWYLTIDPIKHKNKYLKDGEMILGKETNVTRLRDKYITIRVKYKGDQLAIITALRTLYTLSYA